MVHVRGNRPVCHYPISALAGWMAGVSLTSASCRLSLCLGDRPRRRTFHLGYVVASSMLAALFMVMYSQGNWVAYREHLPEIF
jgi:hypothetical protein